MSMKPKTPSELVNFSENGTMDLLRDAENANIAIIQHVCLLADALRDYESLLVKISRCNANKWKDEAKSVLKKHRLK